MAALIEEIAQYLAAQTGYTLETDLFAYGFPPEQADTAVCILDGPGRPEDVRPLAGVGDFDVQVISRAKAPATARSRAYAVQTALHGTCEQLLVASGEWTAQYISAKQTPYGVGYDSRGRYEYVNHYRIRATSA